jgi:formamidopyrimidine-DNA glycosylase
VPELPDITVYLEALETRIVGEGLERLHVMHVFTLRTALPPISAVEGKRVVQLRRLGKRIAIGLEDGHWVVVHLMIAGRLQWSASTVAKRANAQPGSRLRAKVRNALAQFVFSSGVLTLTEAGTKRRASVHLVADESGLVEHKRGGIEVIDSTAVEFAEVLRRENHTLKRSLTDPHLFSGIGNAYSDEILHTARLSPVALTSRLSDDEIERLHAATKRTLRIWTDRLRAEAGDGFPSKVTAFRPDMAVHGKFGQPCPVCGTNVQRIRYAENEVNYCPRCQTGGKLLADRSLSRLLNSDWPKTIDEWEDRQAARR